MLADAERGEAARVIASAGAKATSWSGQPAASRTYGLLTLAPQTDAQRLGAALQARVVEPPLLVLSVELRESGELEGLREALGGGIFAEVMGYNSAVRATTKTTLTRTGIVTLPKKGANNMMPVRRTPIVSNAPNTWMREMFITAAPCGNRSESQWCNAPNDATSKASDTKIVPPVTRNRGTCDRV